MSTTPLAFLAILALVSAGCIESSSPDDDSTSEAAETNPSSQIQDDQTLEYGDVHFFWSVEGQDTLRFEAQHAGGPVYATLKSGDGALTEFIVMTPEDCDGDVGTPGASVGGGQQSYDIVCPEIEQGPIVFEIQVSGSVGAGEFIIEDAAYNE